MKNDKKKDELLSWGFKQRYSFQKMLLYRL